jgi:hypothetical protein
MTRKLDTEDITAITELRVKFQENYSTIGILTIEELSLRKQLKSIEEEKSRKLDEFELYRAREKQLLEKLKEHYGEGQVDIDAGTFTPAQS